MAQTLTVLSTGKEVEEAEKLGATWMMKMDQWGVWTLWEQATDHRISTNDLWQLNSRIKAHPGQHVWIFTMPALPWKRQARANTRCVQGDPACLLHVVVLFCWSHLWCKCLLCKCTSPIQIHSESLPVFLVLFKRRPVLSIYFIHLFQEQH